MRAYRPGEVAKFRKAAVLCVKCRRKLPRDSFASRYEKRAEGICHRCSPQRRAPERAPVEHDETCYLHTCDEVATHDGLCEAHDREYRATCETCGKSLHTNESIDRGICGTCIGRAWPVEERMRLRARRVR